MANAKLAPFRLPMCFLSPAVDAGFKESSVFLVMETLMFYLYPKSADAEVFAVDRGLL